MRNFMIPALACMLWQGAARARTTTVDPPPDDSSQPADATGVVGGATAELSPDFTPLSASERWRLYFISAFGPGAIARAAASAGIRQWEGLPKEWGGGAEAYGDRFGSSLAQHVIRKTLESGGAALLHEDNRYIRSTESGMWKRSKHVIASIFVARNDDGKEHFAYSRFGSSLGAAFISRIWQPPSTNSSGDAAVSFGVTMASSMGWNAFREFWPAGWRPFGRH